MKKNRLLIFLFFLILFIDGWGQEPLLLSLKQAEDLAIQNNYQLNASLHRLEQGYYSYKSSQAYFKPKVAFSSELSIGQDQHGLDSVLRLTQPLYDRVAFYNLKESQIQWEIARLDVQQQICDLLFQVREAYYTILLNQAHLAVDQVIINLWEEEIKRQERYLALGTSIPFELNQAKLHLKGAWSDYHTTQGKIKSSRISLLKILGILPDTVFDLTEQEIPLPPLQWQEYPLDQWRQWAFCYRPQLKQEQFFYLLSQNKVCRAKAENTPSLSAYANAGHHYVNNGFDGQPYIGLGVNVDWTLYDPTNKPRIRQAKEESKEAASNYYQSELEANAIIDDLLNEIEKFYLVYLNAQEGCALAEEGMQMATKKHQLGMMSSFEYRDAIKTLHEARQQINQAKFDLRNAYDRLIQQVGLDLKPH
ncbi:TolC family protein [Candidatus Protochlamydia phocaeensis]|uniref:TolC family protein n=1 Tax=Candidatus Protochlamydia phocaeensis TaxID=1414722 RepID=UPI00083850FA|nr:TolC family protein [Candidatus Protochlamydia phocaeensis]